MGLLPISLLVSSDRGSQCHLKFQLCLTTEYAGVCFWMKEDNFSLNPPGQHVEIFGDVIYIYEVVLTPRLNYFLQFSSCDPWRVFGHSNSPPWRALGHYRHMSSSRQICNIFSWLEILNYCPDDGNGDFQCFSPFLTATFYFVKLKNLVLQIRTIFLGFTPCDGWLREFDLCVLHIYNSVKQEVMAGQFHAPSQPGVLKI